MNTQTIEIKGRIYPVQVMEVSPLVAANLAKLGWDAQGIAQPPKGRARLCNRSAKTGEWRVIVKA